MKFVKISLILLIQFTIDTEGNEDVLIKEKELEAIKVKAKKYDLLQPFIEHCVDVTNNITELIDVQTVVNDENLETLQEKAKKYDFLIPFTKEYIDGNFIEQPLPIFENLIKEKVQMTDHMLFSRRTKRMPERYTFRMAAITKGQSSLVTGVAPKGDHPIFITDFRPALGYELEYGKRVFNPRARGILVGGLFCSTGWYGAPEWMKLFSRTLFLNTTCFNARVLVDSRDLYESVRFYEADNQVTDEQRKIADAWERRYPEEVNSLDEQ